jgi:hypothetical protein
MSASVHEKAYLAQGVFRADYGGARRSLESHARSKGRGDGPARRSHGWRVALPALALLATLLVLSILGTLAMPTSAPVGSAIAWCYLPNVQYC